MPIILDSVNHDEAGPADEDQSTVPSEGADVPGPIRFVTLLSDHNLPRIALRIIQNTLETVWRDAPEWKVGHYLLMPSVLHFFCAPTVRGADPAEWMKAWQLGFKKRAASTSWRWISDHWSSDLAVDECYRERWIFLRAHPVREGWVRHPDQWPHQGVLHDLVNTNGANRP